jgi:alpha-beta hydrolase superfamily lysophospholipase
LTREAFFAEDLSDEQLLVYWKQIQDESYMAFLDMVALDLPRPERVETPVLVLGVGRDNMVSPGEIERTARAYGTRAEFVPEAAHVSMLDPRWQPVAQRILAWLADRRLGIPGTGRR